MNEISKIITELNESNAAKHKKAVLTKYKDNTVLQRVLKMTYDRVAFTYGITLRSLQDVHYDSTIDNHGIEWALDILERDICGRVVTGNDAIYEVKQVLAQAQSDILPILLNVIRRDLRINVGRSTINKVWPGLITLPAYMRCGLYNKKSAKKISWPAILQLKADGTYREIRVVGNEVLVMSRSGESYSYPFIDDAFGKTQSNGYKVPDGYYFGELTVVRDGATLDRGTGNGLINSDNPPLDEIVFDMWDHVPLDQYAAAVARDKTYAMTPYNSRLANVRTVIDNLSNRQIHLIETITAENITEAMQQTSKWMEDGLEGGILKDVMGVFKDGTSPHQLKVKTEIEIDVRVTGFLEGTPGTKREATFGSMIFETDDQKIKGRVAGLSDSQLEDFNNRRQELIGRIITVLCTDITKGRDNDYWALSHPRFIELRDDKDETDTIERAMEAKESAYNLQ